MLTCEGRELPESLQKENLDKNLPKMIESLTYKYHDKSGFQIRPKIIAFDTETYSSNGDIMTLCLSDGNHIEFKKDEKDFQKIVDFFTLSCFMTYLAYSTNNL